MTNEQMSPAVAKRFQDLDDKLAQISGQIGDMKNKMVTRQEYNEAHGPLLKIVQKHERIYGGAVKGLMWLGAATLISAIVSPHWSAVVRGFMEFFK
jgi:hypothetical protein